MLKIFVLSFIFAAVFYTSAHAAEHHLCKYIAAEFGIDFAQNYLIASIAHDEFIPLLEEGDPYYGGHFFCGEGNFFVNVVGGGGDLGLPDNVMVQEVEFSHADLFATLDVVTKHVEENHDNNLTSWGVDVVNNAVVVHMQDLNAKAEAAFKRDVIDSPMVLLKEGAAVCVPLPDAIQASNFRQPAEFALATDNTTLHPGIRIYVDKYGFSIGYPAMRDGKPGFVTALHGLQLQQQEVRLGSENGTVIGAVTTPIRFSGSVDGAFITLNSGTAFDQKTDSDGVLLYSDTRPSQGMILTTISTPPDGITHTQRNVVVTNPNFVAHFGGGLVLSNLIQTTGTAQYGESGGIVFRHIGEDAQVKGVIVGSDIESGANMFFAWAVDIDEGIGVTQK